ncbi:SMI1/KNR4 family protein [Myroides odoratimimus]|uniref:SMI1/KNR4 family protein n=1 Tax=Myroides odoratimimus TaxID=76832 RepID=UPI00090F3B43|nr:SMI1/KNR4 family protein [Myroides odoratimimus]SHL56239.1 SMI1-KNR4 cell-wall [Myroides odoratimimus subsp. xuanwuensis]
MSEFNIKVIGEPTIFGNLEYLESHRFINGLPFPNSYKKFVRKYGYGLLLGQFHIYIPMNNYGDSWNVKSDAIRETYYNDLVNNDIWFELKPDASIEIVKNLVPFGSSDNGYYLFWDIESFFEGEYDIYITDFRGTGFRKVGKNLQDVIREFVTNIDFLPFLKKSLPNIFQCYNHLK